VSTARPRAHHKMTFAVLAAGISAFALLQSLVIPVLPTIQEALGTSQATVTWVLTAYLLSASVFTPILGRVGDMVGKDRVFVATLVALAVGSLLAALATSVEVLIVARVIQGIGGGVLPLSFGIIRDEFPPAEVGGAVGAMAALTAAGSGLGIVLAGPIDDALGYHWLFWIPLIMVTLAAIAAHFVIPASPMRTAGRIGYRAPLLLSAWLVALLLAVSKGTSWGWGSAKVLGLLALAAVIGTVWVRVEQRSVHPLIDMNMMRRPAVWTANLVALLIGIGMYANFAFVPQFLQTPSSAGYGFGASVTSSGLMMVPLTGVMFIFGTFAGRMARRIGSKAVLVTGCAIMVVGFVLLTVAHERRIELVLEMAILGAGIGMAFAAMSSLIVAAVPAKQTGVASGMNANIRTVGGAIGSGAMASIVTANLLADGVPKESGYTNGFAMLAVATVVAMFAAMLIPTPKRNPVTHVEDEPPMDHPELGMVAGGTLSGADPE
jgi:EmrB/QacA subfamily drug resistance transporter